jgi:Flp pilus assembly protein TadG
MIIRSDNRGQTTVLTLVFMVVLLGMSALVLDLGSWYRSDRALQQTADAAALAGAQALPENTGTATSLAIEYANKNGGGLTSSGITFSGKIVKNDTITVKMSREAPGFFSNVLGIKSVTVGAHAVARSANISEAQYVAPITVNWKHPMLPCKPLPCPAQTTIDLQDLHAPGSGNGSGAFGLINLDQNDDGTQSPEILSDWIVHGFDAYLPLGDYNSVPSTMFNSSQVKNAMTASIGKELLFPVYKVITGPGGNAVYLIIGWVGFYVTGFSGDGDTGTVTGHFTRRISTGLQVHSSNEAADYGARAIQLVD